ncbi:hypothetical protein HBI24_066430 [Parastagonospora nodorum]|nr:hypothetical protein HBH51_073790 [Parastagonospora nodorum]KAH4007309.1 hypothetical protein HBI10_001660 [Parastagonospora nodorum]KAH4016546.1 hypothetical protein HBI13_149670 [Parastagonospora nodorum]KAH4198534.1 hypothetical protein HBH42_045570 [Parastagonospora nodorum]KAH4213924.1 hypothetical protein HBI95_000920 [Parastagonospora nodorum]
MLHKILSFSSPKHRPAESLQVSWRNLQSSANKLGVGLGAEGLGPLDGCADGTVDDELRKDTERTRYTEKNGVVVLLGEAVVLEEDTGVGIDVGVWVLGLSVLSENTGGDLVDLADELEHGVIGQVLLGKLALGNVAGVGLAEDGVAVSRNDLAGLEGRPQVILDGLVAEVVANSLLHLLEPDEDFLVGQSVERTSKTVQTSSEREVRRAERAADQVRGVGADVSTLVVGVDGEVQTHQLNEVLVLGETELTLRIGLGEVGLVLESSDGDGELSHWVEIARAAVDELLNELGDVGAGGPLGGQVADLLLGRNLAESRTEPYALECGRDGHVLAELLDLLNLAGELVGEGLLQRLQVASLASFCEMRTEETNSGLAGVEAEAIEGSGPQRSGSAEGASQSQS